MNRESSVPEAAVDLEPLARTVELLRSGRDEILSDWVDRVRVNRSVVAGRTLSEPVLLDHLPQLFDSILERVEMNLSREEATQWAAIHGFHRRITGYDVAETVIELCMLRRAIWAYLLSAEAPLEGTTVAMERIDGMVDRAVITSLQAFLDPAAQMLVRRPGFELPAGTDDDAGVAVVADRAPASEPPA